MQTIKIFLGSSITELHDERVTLGDYLMNSVRPIFKQDGIEVEVLKCEDIRSGNTGENPQDRIDNLLRECDVSVFIFKTRAGNATIHEFDVARELQKSRRHEIYVFCFDVPEEKKEESLKDFQKRLEKEEFYWYTCKDVTDLESQFILGLLKYERQLLGKTKPSTYEQENETEKDADTFFADFMKDEGKRTQRIEKIHQNIEDLLQQTKTVMANEDETIAARIFKVIELYKKADQWAAATAYDNEKYSYLLFDYADFLYKCGLYKDAETVYLRQIDIMEELFGSKSEKTAISYNNIGSVYQDHGNYNQALDYFQKALLILEKTLGTKHSHTTTTYNNIGLVYSKLGDYNKALKYYRKAMATNEKVLGKEQPNSATSYDNMGAINLHQGNYDKASAYFFKAMEISETELGTKNPETARSYNNIGAAYYFTEDYCNALKYYRKALAIWECTFGIEHPNTATSYNNIGLAYLKLGKFDKASEYLFKTLAVRAKVLGKEHPDTGQTYNNIGLLYIEQGDNDNALEYFLKGLEIAEKTLGEKHPETAISYKNISMVYSNKCEYKLALEYLIKAYPIYLRVYGSEHPETEDVLAGIYQIKQALGKNY